MSQLKRLKYMTFFLAFTILFSCGWSRTGAFLAGCITASLFLHAVHHQPRTTVVYEERVYTHRPRRTFRYYCPNCRRHYTFVYGTRSYRCPTSKVVYEFQFE